jgi:Mg/Co/Ni transporter MgtE
MRKRSVLNSIHVDEVWHIVVETPTSIAPDRPLIDLLWKIIDDTRTRHVYVVDGAQRLIGSVRLTTVVEQFFPFEAMTTKELPRQFFSHIHLGAKTVRDIMLDKPFYVKKGTSLSEMAHILIREKINELPVVDDDMRLIGQVNMYEVITRYLQLRD